MEGARKDVDSAVVIRSQSFQKVLWKNGKGSTTQMLINPADCDFSKDPFVYRLSSARVEGDGPFSVFNGMDRFLSILNDESMKISIGEKEEIELKKGAVVKFSGDEVVESKLTGGAVLDLGLIYDRKFVKALFYVNEISKSSKYEKCTALNKGTLLLVSLDCEIKCNFGGQSHSLEVMDVFRVDFSKQTSVVIEGNAENSKIAWIEIEYI